MCIFPKRKSRVRKVNLEKGGKDKQAKEGCKKRETRAQGGDKQGVKRKKGIFTGGCPPEVAVAMVTTPERLSTPGLDVMGGAERRGSVPCEPIAALC